jgi:CRP/FNR family transcriptional regulator, cyclic AMP receptor protein
MIDPSLQGTLHRHPFVEGFAPAHVDTLAALARDAHFDRDQVVFHEGDECHDFYMIVSGLIALEVEEPGSTLRVQTLSAGDELGWSALLMASGKYFQARALDRVQALAFDGPALLAECRRDPAFGFAFMHRLLGVVAARLQHTRLQVHDLYSPVAKRAGT